MKSQLEPSCKPARPVRRRGRKGNAMVEVALLAPWIFFLFIGVLDVGFYCYALMAVGNAARVAALQNSVGLGSANDSAGACLAAARELQSLPNMVGKFTCAGSAGAVSQATPLFAQATLNSTRSPDLSTIVTITYAAMPMIPIPGVLTGQLTIVRTAEMRIGI